MSPEESDAATERAEHPEVIRIDREAQMALEVRRQLSRPDKPGWWRNEPNPHAVGRAVSDDEL